MTSAEIRLVTLDLPRLGMSAVPLPLQRLTDRGPMKLLLVDDHPMVRDGVALLVAQEFARLQLIHAGTLAGALRACEQHLDLGAALLDLNLPDAGGLTALLALRRARSALKIVVMSADDTPERVLGAIDAGAAGYIPKTSPSGDMLAALRLVLAGGVYLPPSVTQGDGSARGVDKPTLRGAGIGLTPRQMEVLGLLIEGKPNKLICRELGLAEATVKTHLAAVFQRLKVNSRTQAVVVAARLGLHFQPDPSPPPDRPTA